MADRNSFRKVLLKLHQAALSVVRDANLSAFAKPISLVPFAG